MERSRKATGWVRYYTSSCGGEHLKVRLSIVKTHKYHNRTECCVVGVASSGKAW